MRGLEAACADCDILRRGLTGNRICKGSDHGVDAGFGGEAIVPVDRYEEAAARLPLCHQGADDHLAMRALDLDQARFGDTDLDCITRMDLDEGLGDVAR